VVCILGFQETRTLRASSGRQRFAAASEHHAVRPPSCFTGLAGAADGDLKTRSQEVHRNSNCGMLRPIKITHSNFLRGWQPVTRKIF
jgi:hypothetical protein